MKDKIMTCIQCEKAFPVTAEEQEKLYRRGFGMPKRCPDCRRKKNKNAVPSGPEGREKWRKKHERGGKRFPEE